MVSFFSRVVLINVHNSASSSESSSSASSSSESSEKGPSGEAGPAKDEKGKGKSEKGGKGKPKHFQDSTTVVADKVDEILFHNTSKHPKHRAGELCKLIGDKCHQMREKGYWKDFGAGLKKSLAIIPLVLEAIVLTARR